MKQHVYEISAQKILKSALREERFIIKALDSVFCFHDVDLKETSFCLSNHVSSEWCLYEQ
ncbi:hypothetical protein V5799_015303, partial [Amblyomma americanum]